MDGAHDVRSRLTRLSLNVSNGRPFHIRIVSSSRVVASALSLLIGDLGMVSTPNPSSEADVDLVDVRGLSMPYSHEPNRPALALLGELNDPEFVLRAGFRGYIRPDDSPESVVRAIHAIVDGQVWGERAVVQRLIMEPRLAEPTFRETEVLQLLVRGSSNRDIAHRLGISVRTVKAHVSSLFEKLGVKSRLELVSQYYKGDLPHP